MVPNCCVTILDLALSLDGLDGLREVRVSNCSVAALGFAFSLLFSFSLVDSVSRVEPRSTLLLKICDVCGEPELKAGSPCSR